MDVFLIVLHGIFFAPIFLRLARHHPRGTKAGQRAIARRSTSARHAGPILFLHGAGLVLLYIGLIIAFTSGRIARTITLQGAGGATVILFAVVLMVWSSIALQSWRVLPKVDAGHELCTTGPYGVVRHPMYLAIDLLGLGSAVWVPAWPVIIGAVLLWLGGDLRARIEERVLLEAFGDRYGEYMERVRRMLPVIY